MREGFPRALCPDPVPAVDQAQELAERSIAAINRVLGPGARTGTARPLEGEMGLEVEEWDAPFVSGLARAIGPIVKYHRATGSRAALDLAVRLKDTLLELGSRRTVRTIWNVSAPHPFDHLRHVVLGPAWRSDEDADLMARVQAFYGRGLKDISDDLGWSIENGVPEANPDRGEANNTGDILETALLLGTWGDARRLPPGRAHPPRPPVALPATRRLLHRRAA